MQCANCLNAASLRLRLLLNFGKPRLEIKRVACGLRTAPENPRVLRASALICDEFIPASPQW
jgi:hypothetical protein